MKEFIAAITGSLASLGCVYPTEVYKRALHLNTRLDSQVRLSHFTILKSLFPFGFYKGFLSCAVGVVPKNAFPLFVYPQAKGWWNGKVGEGSASSLLTGASLSLCATVLTSPTENLSLRKSNFPTSSTMRYALMEGGWKKLYVGFTGFLMMDFIRIGIKFGLYSEIEKVVRPLVGECEYRWMPQALSGAMASSLVALFTNPVDVAHTKFRSDYTHSEYNNSFLKALRTTKMRDLYCGFTVRALRGLPGGFVMFGTYEHVKSLLSK